MMLGAFSLIASIRVFNLNAVVLYGMLIMGFMLVLLALLTKVRGGFGLGMAGGWLIVMCLLNMYGMHFVYEDFVMGILAFLAGLLMILGV